MSKINRFNGNLQPFALNASNGARYVFGNDAVTGNDLDSNITADFIKGWENGTVTDAGGNDYPPMSFFNALGYTSTALSAYLHQVGVPDYNALQEYYEGSLTNVDGVLYASKSGVDGTPNVGNNPETDRDNWKTINVPDIDTIADLRALTSTPDRIWVSGYHTKGDGAFGSNIFRWNPTSTEDDNGGTIIKLDSIEVGRYELQYSGAVNVKWFGAVGGTDSSPCIKKAIESNRHIFIPEDINIFKNIEIPEKTIIEGEEGTHIEVNLTDSEYVFKPNGSFITIKNIDISHSLGYGTHLGTAIKANSAHLTLENMFIKYFKYGVEGESNHFYQRYIRIHQQDCVYYSEATDINANTYDSCYFNSINFIPPSGTTTGNSIVFNGCDFSGNPSLGDKPYRFVNCSSISINSAYSEFIPDGGVGSYTVFSFERDDVSGNVPLCASINDLYYTNNGTIFDTLLYIKDTNVELKGGFQQGLTNLSKIDDGGLILHNDGTRYSTNIVDPTSSTPTRVIRMLSSGFRFGENTETPSTSNKIGSFLTRGKLDISNPIELNLNPLLLLNKQDYGTSTNRYIQFLNNGAEGMYIGTRDGNLYVENLNGGVRINTAYGYFYIQDNSVRLGDDTNSLGTASARWSEVFAANGTINTSDDREKTYLTVNEKETLVAKELKGLMKKFKFNNAIETKGEDKARIHFGTSAQTVKATFEKYGLVAEDYALLCYDSWEEEKDEEGNITQEAGDRYGIRYEELLCFIISAI